MAEEGRGQDAPIEGTKAQAEAVTVEEGTRARTEVDTIEEGAEVEALVFFLFWNASAGDFDFFKDPLAEVKGSKKEKESQPK